MALTYDAIAQFSKISDYFKALKKEKSLVFNQGKFMLIVINYKGKLDKKTTIINAYKTEPLAIKAFQELKNNANAKKDVKKNQVALGSYTIDKETGMLNFEITKGAAGPKKINKKAAKLLKSIYKLNLVATLGANYDGEGELIDDSDEPDDIDDDIIIEDESPDEDETEDEPETATKPKPETPTKLDPQVSTLAVSINKGIKQLTEKTAPDAKALSVQLLADIPKFLQLATDNAALMSKQLADFVPIATAFLKKIEKATASAEPKEKAPLNENQKKARQLNTEINALVQKIMALEKANAAKKK